MTHAVLPCRNHLGASLRRWRALNRVKQSALAEELRVSQTTISRWEAGTLIPGPREEDRLAQLLAARPTSAADRALLDLVRRAPGPVHLICDLTHRLFAASPTRISAWRVGVEDLAGTSLWRFASPGIAKGEAALDALGWYAPLAPAVSVDTEQAHFDELSIAAGRLRYTRMPLSDGRFARLVEDGARAGGA
jgi:transcriptional regulator with XRE-family HTH domain